MSTDCGNHGDEQLRQAWRRALTTLLALALAVAAVALVVYLVLRPTHPRFSLQDASLRQLDLSPSSNASSSGLPALLSTALQATVASRNPNGGVGVYYDRLDAYASYRGQQVTVAASLPAAYQGRGDVDVWSPVLSGPAVPLAPYLATAVAQDCQAGRLLLQVKIDGRVRWKVGSWVSGHYHLFVTCPAFLVTEGGGDGDGAPEAGGFKFKTGAYDCHVEV